MILEWCPSGLRWPVTSLVECNTMGQISASYRERRRKTIALIEPIVAELSVDPLNMENGNPAIGGYGFMANEGIS